jgi:hypothetical protein
MKKLENPYRHLQFQWPSSSYIMYSNCCWQIKFWCLLKVTVLYIWENYVSRILCSTVVLLSSSCSKIYISLNIINSCTRRTSQIWIKLYNLKLRHQTYYRGKCTVSTEKRATILYLLKTLLFFIMVLLYHFAQILKRCKLCLNLFRSNFQYKGTTFYTSICIYF